MHTLYTSPYKRVCTVVHIHTQARIFIHAHAHGHPHAQANIHTHARTYTHTQRTPVADPKSLIMYWSTSGT